MARRGKPSGDSKKYYDWLDYAASDLAAAYILKDQQSTLLLSAFHAQQSIEKALKSYFLRRNGYAPDGHNIIFLCKKAARENNDFSQWLDECVTLNNYYIATRYPPDFPLKLDEKKAAKLCAMAKDIYNFVIKEIYDSAKA